MKLQPRIGNFYGSPAHPVRLGETWIESESLAYNTPSGSVHGSGRRGLVRFADGSLRIVRLGVPDTYFTIPAKPSRCRVGFVSVSETAAGEQEFGFTLPQEPGK